VILTALFASPHFSDRAFRLLPWTTPLYPHLQESPQPGPPESPGRSVDNEAPV